MAARKAELPRQIRFYGGELLDADTGEPLLLWGVPSRGRAAGNLAAATDFAQALIAAYNAESLRVTLASLPDGGLMTTVQVAERKGVAVRIVVGAINRGDLRAVRLGRDWWVAQTDADAWEPQRRVGKPSKKTA
jgi:hypothetical protein